MPKTIWTHFYQKNKNDLNIKNTLVISEKYYCDDSTNDIVENHLYRFICALSNAIVFSDFKTFINFKNLYTLLINQQKKAFIFEDNVDLSTKNENLNINFAKNEKDLLNNI